MLFRGFVAMAFFATISTVAHAQTASVGPMQYYNGEPDSPIASTDVGGEINAAFLQRVQNLNNQPSLMSREEQAVSPSRWSVEKFQRGAANGAGLFLARNSNKTPSRAPQRITQVRRPTNGSTGGLTKKLAGAGDGGGKSAGLSKLTSSGRSGSSSSGGSGPSFSAIKPAGGAGPNFKAISEPAGPAR